MGGRAGQRQPTPEDLERALQRIGMSEAAARGLIARGWDAALMGPRGNTSPRGTDEQRQPTPEDLVRSLRRIGMSEAAARGLITRGMAALDSAVPSSWRTPLNWEQIQDARAIASAEAADLIGFASDGNRIAYARFVAASLAAKHADDPWRACESERVSVRVDHSARVAGYVNTRTRDGIALAANLQPAERHMTLIHELGHFVLEHEASDDRLQIEAEAAAFAAAFLGVAPAGGDGGQQQEPSTIAAAASAWWWWSAQRAG
ncbi:MAG: ImmA/IrrE family metallo-endopeptidase [Dehalococcoidia bacterium]